MTFVHSLQNLSLNDRLRKVASIFAGSFRRLLTIEIKLNLYAFNTVTLHMNNDKSSFPLKQSYLQKFRSNIQLLDSAAVSIQGITVQGKETRYINMICGKFPFEVFRIFHCEVYNNYSLQGGAFGIYLPTEKPREERRSQIALVNYWVNFVRMTE